MGKFKKSMDKKVKKMDFHDIRLVKLSTLAFTLFILNIWPSAMNWVANIHWGWFLGATILFAFRPMKRYWGK